MSSAAFIYWPDFVRNLFSAYNIQGYHTYGNGQTVCIFGVGPANVVRVSRDQIAHPHKIGYPSFTVVDSPSRVLSYFIENKLISGEFHLIKAVKTRRKKLKKLETECSPRGFWPLSAAVTYPPFRIWYASLRLQCDTVREDKSSHVWDSRLRESIDEIKEMLEVMAARHAWTSDEMDSIVRTAQSEMIVQNVMTL
jgi:hypothetical protein